ncbi:hypothetical protein OPQ81_001917 [Rhizoctonia solani]|nr:hypothetical protein OPQ81_001917 [Rhizoctonia solani]
MKLLVLLGLVAAVLAQDQTQSLAISATATPTATLPITPPSQRPLATCSADPLWRRLRNVEGIDPCALAMNLQRTCTTIDPIVQLTGGESYTGPQNVEAATPCICTTIMYNLVAGCAACQHQLSTKVTRNWVNWKTWSALCQNPDTIQDGVWNRATLYNSTIPAWAYVKVFQTDMFDLQQAINIGVSSTATPSSTSTPTTTPHPVVHTSNKVSIIVGAVLGSVGFILLLITISFCYLRHRQRKWEESEGVNRPDSTFIISKPTPARQSLQKTSSQRYGPGGLFSPTNDTFEKPRPIRTETALPDVLSDEHQQGKPEYAMPAPTPSYPSPGGGFGGFPEPQTHYTPVPNPGAAGVAGVGAGGRGLQNENRNSVLNSNVNRVAPRDGPQGAAAQMLAADIAAARAREGAFREDFSAEGPGYQTSTDADGQSHRNGNSRTPFAPMPHAYSRNNSGNSNGNGKAPATGPHGADHDEEPHAVSTFDDTSVSLYPSSLDRHGDHPPPFVGGFSPVPEKPKEEYQLPDRGYSSNGAQPSPPLDADPFGANRRPAAFSRVFGERSGNMAGIGAGRASAGNSPTSPTAAQGRASVISRAGASPIVNRPNISPPQMRRGPSLGASAADMGFGRQHQVAVNALGGSAHRDSSGISEGSSPTAVGFPGDVGSSRGEGSPLPSGPFAGRSGFGVERHAPAPAPAAAPATNGTAAPTTTTTTTVGSAAGAAAAAPAAPRSAQNKDGNSTLGTFQVKSGLAQMLKGGVIMDVVNAEQARIAEEAGACAVMALERVPADIRKEGGVARMSDPKMIKEIVDAVTIPVMAKVRIGHFVEAQILQAIGIDYIDESEPHRSARHFAVSPKAVRHARAVNAEIRKAAGMTDEELYSYAKEIQAPFHLLKETARLKRLPVVSFAAGGVATPADAALMMQLGCDGVFVGSGIFLSGDPAKRARAIVQAVTHYNNPKVLAEVSEDLGEAMVGLTIDKDLKGGRMAGRGW